MSRGLRIFEAPSWFAVFLPRGASEPIIRKLDQAAFATADTPSVQERLNVLAKLDVAQIARWRHRARRSFDGGHPSGKLNTTWR
jgi:tripartite-type tricarboxylate transporter receptor subunit TctC